MRYKTIEDRCHVSRLTGQDRTRSVPYMVRLNQPAGQSDTSKQLTVL